MRFPSMSSLVTFTSFYHFGIGIALIATGPQLVTNALLLYALIPDETLRPFVYIFAALLPIVRGVWPEMRWGAAALWPQQLLLFLSSASVVLVLYQGHYADGEIRDRGFIFVDQWVTLVVTAFHLRETLKL